jgi:hypothetical protein
MRARGAAIQGGLAALGLVVAYGTWQREPEKAAGEAIVVEASKNDLTKVRFEDGAKWVELDARKDPATESGNAVWLRVSKTEAPKAPEREVRGNDGATRLFERFAPLRATRALGTLDAAKLKELGLDAPKKKIEITARGSKRVLLVGSSPFNVSDPYVMDESDKRVYVLGGGIVSDLDAAAVRLVDRTLHTFKVPDFDGLTIATAGKKRELVQTGAENPMNAKLASKKTPGKPDDQAKNWHDKLWRMYVTEVLGKGEAPEKGNPEVMLRVDYTEKGKQKGHLEIAKLNAPAAVTPGTPTPPAPVNEFYARSEHTAGWAKLPDR